MQGPVDTPALPRTLTHIANPVRSIFDTPLRDTPLRSTRGRPSRGPDRPKTPRPAGWQGQLQMVLSGAQG